MNSAIEEGGPLPNLRYGLLLSYLPLFNFSLAILSRSQSNLKMKTDLESKTRSAIPDSEGFVSFSVGTLTFTIDVINLL